MNARLKSMFRLAIWFALFSILLSTGAMPATAQELQPPVPPEQIEDQSTPQNPFARRAPGGNWYMPAGIQSDQLPAQASRQSTGGPDEFGYTWDVWMFNWIDVTNGTNTGFSGYSYDQATGPITIPFPFKYYENTYNKVYIAASGYLSFTEADYWDDQADIPSPGEPNNVVAPYWSPVFIDGWVRYLSGGSAPNRYFVVEWHDVVGNYDYNDYFNFEVILHENGDIDFQYQQMAYLGGYWCGVAGIEDAQGVDGLNSVPFCEKAPSTGAVRFFRPPPSARVRIEPSHQGELVSAGQTSSFALSIRNTGELGSDTFDLLPNSDSWSWKLTTEEGNPFNDTNSNGIIDTGPLDQGSTIKVIFTATAPDSAQTGNSNHASLTVQSSKDDNKSSTAHMRTAIPAPFVQALKDYDDGAISIYLAQPAGQVVKKVTEDSYDGYYPAIAETPDGFAMVWERYVSNGSDIEFALLDRYGEKTGEVSRLTHQSEAGVYTFDYEPKLVAAPNGRVGVIWHRRLYSDDWNQKNDNIYFAILDNQGSLVSSPTNLTQNNIWGSGSDLGVPSFYNSHIAVTTDNHFLLVWERYQPESGGSLEDVFIAVRGPAGGEIKPVTNFTKDTPGLEPAYYAPAIAGLEGNKGLLTYLEEPVDHEGTNTVLSFLDSNGNEFLPRARPFYYDYGPWERDIVQYSNGKIVLGDISAGTIVYTTFNQDFQIIDSDAFDNPASANGNHNISLAADNSSHAILTWSDVYDPSHLYYGLLDTGGGPAEPTPAMIFYSSSDPIVINDAGYGNTSFSWTPPEGVDGFAELKGEAFNAPPGGVAAVKVYASNYGATQATNVTLTATLDSALTYLSDTSGITPTKNGNQLIWNLPDLGLLDYLKFTLYVQLAPGAEYGSTHPVTLSLVSDGPEVDPDNNLDGAAVVAVRQVFIPVVRHDYR